MKLTTDMRPATSRPLASGKLPGDILARLISQYRTPADESVIVQPKYGFDAAAISLGGETLLVKSDPITFATEGAARYLVAVNANDIACMGGVPRWLTVVALLPGGTTTEDIVESLFADLRDACIELNVTLIGGHTEITVGLDHPLLIGTMLGVTGPTGLLMPGMASVGDDLYVTKWIGIEGTALLAHERAQELSGIFGNHSVGAAQALLKCPGISITEDARAVLQSAVVTALHDPTEGGIATAVHEIAGASGLGAVVARDSIPIRPETRTLCEHFRIDPLGLLSSGALLIAAQPGSEEQLRKATEASGIPIARIGHLTEPEHGFQLTTGDDKMPLPRYDADELTRVL